MLHAFLLELFRFVELVSEGEKHDRGDGTQGKRDSPDGAEVVLGENLDQDIWDESTKDKSTVNHDVGEDDEPSVPAATLHLAGGFTARD